MVNSNAASAGGFWTDGNWQGREWQGGGRERGREGEKGAARNPKNQTQDTPNPNPETLYHTPYTRLHIEGERGQVEPLFTTFCTNLSVFLYLLTAVFTTLFTTRCDITRCCLYYFLYY